MNHVKALGLALLAALALSAVASSVAQAAEVTAPTYPANLTVKDAQTEHGKLTRFTIGNGARFIECTVANLTGTLTGEKASREKVTTHATFENCFANGLTAVPVTVTMNGCDLTLNISLTSATLSVMCPHTAEDPVTKKTLQHAIQIHIYENEAKHKENKPLCTYDITDEKGTINQNLGAISIAAGETDKVADLTLGVNLKEIRTTSTLGAAGLCGIASGVTGNSSLVGAYTVTGETSAGVAQGIMTEK